MELKIFKCAHCGNIITYVKDKGVPVICCGEKMNELKPNTVDASTEKHLPIITLNNNVVMVKVGSVPHPMTQEHFIEWIAVETQNGLLIKHLSWDDYAAAEFILTPDEKVLAAYAFCNLHGFWKAV